MTQSAPLTTSPLTLSLPMPSLQLQACVSSTDILRGHKAVQITHNGSSYKLQATRLGKLILTK